MTSAVLILSRTQGAGCVFYAGLSLVLPAPETGLGPVCGVQSFKHSVLGAVQGLTLGQIRLAAGHSPC